MPGYVAYFRVSTDKQGKTGLGMDAQREAVSRYRHQHPGEMLAEFVEVETGKHANRPELQDALALSRRRKATLIIAKLDRLARNVHFISGLMESGVDFVACDYPQANRLTIHILAAVAEHEREMISQRTKDALAARRARGLPLGTPRPVAFLKEMAAKKRTANQPRRDAALPLLLGLQAQGLTLRKIANEMNRRDMKPTGHARQWYASTVRYHLKRHQGATA